MLSLRPPPLRPAGRPGHPYRCAAAGAEPSRQALAPATAAARLFLRPQWLSPTSAEEEGTVAGAVRVCGYAGGQTPNPTYRQVCSDRTGHAEVVEVTFDPAKIAYGRLVELFFKMHDPTQLNRQGPDIGTQYRSAIFFHSPEQEAAARDAKAALEKAGVFKRSIVTEIVPAPDFYRAEDYHQQYFEKHGMRSCHLP